MLTQNQPTPQNLLNQQSPNLLKEEAPKLSPEQSSLFSAIFNFEILVVLLAELIILLLIGYNYKLQRELNSLDEQIKSKDQQTTQILDFLKQTNQVRFKTAVFEALKTGNPKTENKIGLVYTLTPQEIALDRLEYDQTLASNRGKMSLSAITAGAPFFAKFIGSYLSSGSIDQIILTGAAYNTFTKNYNFEVDIYFKENL